MLCKDCDYFRIKWEPQKIGGQLVDWGQAECVKHDLVTDFRSHKKFETLECVEEEMSVFSNGIKRIDEFSRKDNVIYPEEIIGKKYGEAIDMAMKALEQEPCEDAISRQAVLNKILKFSATAGRSVSVKGLWTEVNDLPSVTPRQKTGHWIRVDKDKCKCDQCEVVSFIAMYPNGDINYCPNCGAKMVGPQESEEE